MSRSIEPAEDARGRETAPARPDEASGPGRAAGREELRGGRDVPRPGSGGRSTLAEIGRFRVIGGAGLRALRDGGAARRMRCELDALLAQGLVQRKTVWTGRDGETETFFALTAKGRRLALADPARPPGQAVYAGFAKAAELRHDAQIYPMFLRESERIAREGGRVRRVLLDYEIKKNAYAALAKAARPPAHDYARRQREIAAAHGLKVVNGHIALPDLRIEYETRPGELRRLDLEVASASYHGSHAAEKAAAGFRIYAAPETAGRLSAALEEREITAEVLRL